MTAVQKKKLTDLDDDCLLLICEYLSIYDHISILSVSHRFQPAIEKYYKINKQATLDEWNLDKYQLKIFRNYIDPFVEDLIIKLPTEKSHLLKTIPPNKVTTLELKLNGKENGTKLMTLKKFVECTSSKLKTMHLMGNCRNWYTMFPYSFPSMTSLCINNQDSPAVEWHMTPDKYPQLKTLKYCFAQVPRICEFTNITELHISLTFSHQNGLRRIFESLPLRHFTLICGDAVDLQGLAKCATLEILYLVFLWATTTSHVINLDEITKLENFKVLKFLNPGVRYGDLRSAPSHPILIWKHLVIDASHWEHGPDLVMEWSTNLTSLIRFKVKIPEYKIDIKGCIAALEMLKHCKNLEDLDITFPCNSSAETGIIFLKQVFCVIETFHSKREQPLSILCQNLNMEAKELKNISMPNCVELVLGDGVYDDPEAEGITYYVCD